MQSSSMLPAEVMQYGSGTRPSDTLIATPKSEKNAVRPSKAKAAPKDDETFQEKFGLPRTERVIGKFSCAIHKDIPLHGKMYLTRQFICFYSKIFGHRTKELMPLRSIVAIEKKNTSLFMPNAIEITVSAPKSGTHRNGTTKFFFTNFLDRDPTIARLRETWEAAKNGEVVESKTPKSAATVSSSTPGGEAATAVATVLQKQDASIATDASVHVAGAALATSTAAGDQITRKRHATAVAFSTEQGVPIVDESAECLADYIDLVPDLQLPCDNYSADDVFELLFGDRPDARQLWSDYHVQRRDKEVVVGAPPRYRFRVASAGCSKTMLRRLGMPGCKHAPSNSLAILPIHLLFPASGCPGEWQRDVQHGCVRTLTWRSPVNAPIGPKHTAAIERQRVSGLRESSSPASAVAFRVETSAEYLDIPYADHFCVETITTVSILRPRDTEGSGTGSSSVAIRVRGGVSWKKSTWWKSRIESGVRSESVESFALWATVFQQAWSRLCQQYDSGLHGLAKQEIPADKEEIEDVDAANISASVEDAADPAMRQAFSGVSALDLERMAQPTGDTGGAGCEETCSEEQLNASSRTTSISKPQVPQGVCNGDTVGSDHNIGLLGSTSSTAADAPECVTAEGSADLISARLTIVIVFVTLCLLWIYSLQSALQDQDKRIGKLEAALLALRTSKCTDENMLDQSQDLETVDVDL